MAIIKSLGTTRTERLLAELCDKSFLRMWSYPNPFKEDGKELCDLLAVFENHAFIFFDRENRQIDNPDKDPMVAWGRWKRDTIDAQTKTAKGAERYLRSGRPIFLDAAHTVAFPLNIDRKTMIVHKIIVAHGAKEACERASEDNVAGSLGIIYGDGAPPPFPFFVDLDRRDPIHVLDSHNLEIVFDELDTFFDFTTYLDAKVDAIRRFDMLAYCGEEDLLAHYFLNFDDEKNRHFIGTKDKDVNGLMIGEGEWRDFCQLEPYKRKKEADKVSRLWDDVIQRTCSNALNGTLMGDAKLLQGKSAIYEMAKEPRFFRRELSDRMIHSIRNFPETPDSIMRNLSFMPSFYPGKGYVFLQLKVDNVTDYENGYRPKRRAMLEIACGAAKNRFPEMHMIIGIAIDAPKFSKRNSEDFLLMECADWPEDRKAHYERANEGFGFFQAKSQTIEMRSPKEFP